MQSMQRRTSALIFAMAGFFFTNLTHALGLGEITLESSLNEPLDAEIRLLEVRDLSRSEIVAQLASREAFERIGVDRPFFLNKIKFSIDLSDRDNPVIHLRSENPIVEPYINFLLEVQWPSGRLLREYTLLMDLPIYEDDQGDSSSKVAAPSVTPYAVTSDSQAGLANPDKSNPGKAETTSLQSSITTRAAPATPLYDAESADAGSESKPSEYQVQDGDTLWEIALKARPDSSVRVHQSMLAIQRTNPEAFIDGNINLLRKGEVLRFPTKAEMQSVDAQQAISEVSRQNQQWSNEKTKTGAVLKGDSKATPLVKASSTEPEGRLKLSAIDSTSTDTAKVSGADGTGKSLENKLIAAQEELDRARQENTEYSERIEQLEAQIETMEKLVEISNDKLRALQLAAASNDEANEKDEYKTSQPEMAIDKTALADTIQTRGVEADSAEANGIEESAADKGTKKQKPAPSLPSDQSPAQLTPSDLQPVTEPVKSEGGIVDTLNNNLTYIAVAAIIVLLFTMLLMRFRNRDNDDELDLIDEQELVDEGQFEPQDDMVGSIEPEIDTSLVDETLDATEDQFEEPIDDDVDAVDKANIFISLGQYDQAEKLLMREIEANPDNTSARFTLLKIYSETQNISEFDVQYAQLLPMGDASVNAKAGELRAKIPNAGEFDVSDYIVDHAVEDGLDLSDFDKPLTEDDTSIGPEEQIDHGSVDEQIPEYPDLGTSSAPDEADTLDDLTMDLDNLSAEETEADPIDTSAENILDFDSDADSEVDGLETYDPEPDELEPISSDELENQLDFESVDDLADNETSLTDTSDLDFSSSDDDLSEIENIDFSTVPDEELTDDTVAESASTDANKNDEVADPLQTPVDMESLNEEISSIIDDQAQGVDDQDANFDFDDDFSDLDSDDSDQVATKLDLALAYLDMGDGEGAKDILVEVIDEGTPEQQNKAKELMKDL